MLDKSLRSQIIDGKTISQQLLSAIRQQIHAWQAEGRPAPGLAVILVGEDSASSLYVRNKVRACQKVGVLTEKIEFPNTCSEQQLIERIEDLNNHKNINGILVQLPLPAHINVNRIMECISPDKDVDCFHPYNLGRMHLNIPGLMPCTPTAVMYLLQQYKIATKGAHAVVIGASYIVGRPMAALLTHAGATVTLCHILTKNLEYHTRQADILVSATGKAHLIQASMIADNCVIMDVGISYLPNGRMVGDVQFETCAPKAQWITPVPGGVGPMTVAQLLKNVTYAYQCSEKLLS